MNNKIEKMLTMKKFTLIFALFTLVSIVVTAQPQLTWRFANAEVINAGTQLQFDVEVMADAGVTYHRDLQVYFDYNTAGFGSDIVANGYVTVTPLALMNTHYVIVNSADNTSSKFAVITEGSNEMTQSGSATYFNEMPTTFTGLLRFTIDIMDNTQTAGIAFDEALMNGGQYYQSTSNTDPIKYVDPCLYDNDLSSLLLSTLYGNITYRNVASTPVESCSLTLKQGAVTIGTAMTDVNGDYYFTGVADGAYTIETDCSLPRGGTGLVDIVQTRQFLLGTITFDPLQQLSADVDAGGSVGLVDVVQMRQYLLGTIPGWAQSDWVFFDQSVNVSSGMGMIDYQGLCSGDPDRSHTP
jgi:hypothetical protein